MRVSVAWRCIILGIFSFLVQATHPVKKHSQQVGLKYRSNRTNLHLHSYPFRNILLFVTLAKTRIVIHLSWGRVSPIYFLSNKLNSMLSLITALFSVYWLSFVPGVFISLQWLFAWQSVSSNLPLTCGCHEVAHSIVRMLPSVRLCMPWWVHDFLCSFLGCLLFSLNRPRRHWILKLLYCPNRKYIQPATDWQNQVGGSKSGPNKQTKAVWSFCAIEVSETNKVPEVLEVGGGDGDLFVHLASLLVHKYRIAVVQ